MILTVEKAIDIAIKHLQKLKLPFRGDLPIKGVYEENEKIRTHEVKNVWVVSYEYDMLDHTELNFIFIEDDTTEVLYIMTPHGYIENDEDFDYRKKRREEDEEDWDNEDDSDEEDPDFWAGLRD